MKRGLAREKMPLREKIPRRAKTHARVRKSDLSRAGLLIRLRDRSDRSRLLLKTSRSRAKSDSSKKKNGDKNDAKRDRNARNHDFSLS